jgi:flagellar motor switch/type III secretory pathway protein FliN
MENKKDKFKQKGKSILDDSRPNSMKDFLEGQKDAQILKDAITQLPKTTESQKQKYAPAQNRNYTKTQNSNGSNQDTVDLERIHVQIRKELADKLFGQIYAQKCKGKKATQRHIIEKALEEYFEK